MFGLAILGALGGLLGASLLGRASYAGQQKALDAQTKALDKQTQFTKQKEKTMEALAIPKIGRQRGRGSLSSLGGILSDY